MSPMLPLSRYLQNLPVYQPGRPIEEVARELGMAAHGIIKVASNENPLGPSPKAMEAVKAMLGQTHLYPDGNAFYLKQKLSAKLGVGPEHLILGNGSNEIIEFVAHALLEPGTNIVVSEYCFAIYPIVARMMGADVITVPARDYGHHISRMVGSITEQTRIIFVANPNNPTGTLAQKEEIWELLDRVPPRVLIVLDEAYFEFLSNPPDLLPQIRQGTRQNLILMRTFSKIYGLAGFRLGYGIGSRELVAALEKVRQPFNINSLAQAAGIAALDDVEHLEKTRRNNTEGRQYLESQFKSLGLEYVPSHANFVLARVQEGQRIFLELQKRGVIVRPMGGYQLPEWIRVSVGSTRENVKLIEALKEILAG